MHVNGILYLFFALATIACDTTGKIQLDTDIDNVQPSERDADGDGYYAEEDCNDTLPNVNPGALEVCDGVDNNCDGTIDEGVTGLFYFDEDGDGFGNPNDLLESCDTPTGYVPVSNDCDDTNATVYPGADEICDDLDNDCDGEIDNANMGPWYPDMDGDGFGVLEGAIDGCDPPNNYVPTPGDCDDNDSEINPLATEECDQIDNNCNGQIDDGIGIVIYLDSDNDGYGDPNQSIGSCVVEPGYVVDNTDCDDSDPLINPETVWYLDYDNDGFGDDEYQNISCIQPNSHVLTQGDCDDTDAGINPNAVDICDGIDNNCSGLIDDGLNTGQYWYLDLDNDGFGDNNTALYSCQLISGMVDIGDDCNDNDSTINPNAEEICDTIDNDCDNLIDDADPSINVMTGVEFYIDLDGDGHGDSNAPIMACSLYEGLSSVDDDCDDTSPIVYPSSLEYCDGIDNNCNLLIDEDDPSLQSTQWYLDNDSDGYGLATMSITLNDCGVPSGYSTLDGDCDDFNDLISPGASEICHDEVDNNCNNEADCNDIECDSTDICFQPWRICTETLDNELLGSSTFNYLGAAGTALGDVNGDGYDDFAVSAYGNSDAGPNTGKIYVFFGGAFDASDTLNDANCIITGESDFDNAGWSLSGGGDVDGDGKDDLLVSAPNHDENGADSGAVFLFYGASLTGLCQLSTSDADHRFFGEVAGDKAGESIAFAGDIDGDSKTDVIIGASNNDDAGANSGKVYVLYAADIIQSAEHQLSNASLIIRGEDPGDYLGWSLDGGGDLNGDGSIDVVLGAPGEMNSVITPGKLHYFNGATLMNFSGSNVISASQADLTLLGQNNSDRAGYAVAFIGDVEGDGNSDVMVSAIENDLGGENAGIVYLLHSSDLLSSPSLYLTSAAQKFIGEAPGDHAGSSIAIQQDINDDGIPEIWIGAYANGFNGPSTGRIYQMSSLRYANRTVSLSEASLFFGGIDNYEWFGRHLSNLGDVNGDGQEDMLMGAPNNSQNGNYSGKFYYANFPLGQQNTTIQFNASIFPDENSNTLRCQPDDCVPEPLEGFADWINESDGASISSDSVLLLNNDNVHYLDPITCTLNLFDVDGNEHTDSYTFNSTALVPQHTWAGVSSQDKLGISIASNGDVDNDALVDILSGAPRANTPNGQSGAIFIWPNSNGFSGDMDILNATMIYGESPNDKAGRALAFVGNLNEDTMDDIVVGAPGAYANTGVVYLVMGDASLTDTDLGSASDLIITGDNNGDFFGQSVQGVGDIDNDGIDDFLVGSPGLDDAFNNIGGVYVFMGAEATPTSTSVASDAWALIMGLSEGEKIGQTINGAGDIDGDGLNDILIGSPALSKTYVFYSSDIQPNMTVGDASALLYSFDLNSEFGASVSIGEDIDSDGIDDVLIGAPSDALGTIPQVSYGAVYLFSGATINQSANMTASMADVQFYSNQANSLLGSHVSILNDLDGGGVAEFGMGAPGYDGVFRNAGRIGIFYSENLSLNATYALQDANRIHDGQWTGAEIGRHFTDSPNIDSVGDSELLIGVWQNLNEPNMPGSVLLISEF